MIKKSFLSLLSWSFLLTSGSTYSQPSKIEEASLEDLKALEGRYAHYDIVAYAERVGITPMRTLIITYGFSDFSLEGDRLVETDIFCHSEHRTNLPFSSNVDDAFTRAIVPKSTEVDVYYEDGQLVVHRPPTPTPIGIDLEDPENTPLPMDPKDPRITDDDNDGKPGVTVDMRIFGFLPGEIYIARREIFSYTMDLQDDGSLLGIVDDDSEQLVVGSSLRILRSNRNPKQNPDKSLSPIMLVPVDASYDCDRLMEDRDLLFPENPKP